MDMVSSVIFKHNSFTDNEVMLLSPTCKGTRSGIFNSSTSNQKSKISTLMRTGCVFFRMADVHSKPALNK
jgi:hypothetical protein